MKEALTLLSELSDSDIDWIFSTGIEEQVIASTQILKEGESPDALYFVLAGLLAIKVHSLGDRQLATLGPGEIVGEMSFLENQPASASVVATENSLLLALPRNKLYAKLKDDSQFAARLYKSFAVIASRRLRERVGTLGHLLGQKSLVTQVTTDSGSQVLGALQTFKELMHKADSEALKNDGVVPKDTTEQIQNQFSNLVTLMNSTIGDDSSENAHVKEELGARVQREMLPYILLTQLGERSYSKPRGYAGDFFTFELVYRNEPEGFGRLGPILDRCFLNLSVTKESRNRRRLLGNEITRLLEGNPGSVVNITSLACGPAAEVFDVFAQIDNPECLKVNLIDIDLQALAFVAERRDKRKLRRYINLVNANLVYLATGREHLNIEKQHLIYSIGLIDYFSDDFVITLLNYVYDLLKPGGKVILGNFHSRNPDKAFLDYVLDWRVIHRTEDDLNRLFAASKFNRPCTKVQVGPERIQLFAECIHE